MDDEISQDIAKLTKDIEAKVQPKAERTPNVPPSYVAVVAAAKALLDKYKEGHTVTSNEDYKYPGLKELADALDKIK